MLMLTFWILLFAVALWFIALFDVAEHVGALAKKLWAKATKDLDK